MVGSGFNVGALQTEKTLKGLNEKMFEFIQSNQLIGVSLKKITGTGRISKKNFPTDKKLMTASYRGTSTNLDAMALLQAETPTDQTIIEEEPKPKKTTKKAE